MPLNSFGAAPWRAALVIAACTWWTAVAQPATASAQTAGAGGKQIAGDCSLPGGQSPPAVFVKAVNTFASPQQADSIPLFSEVLDVLGPRGARRTAAERAVYACGLRYRAEARLNLGRPAEADQDLNALCDAEPTFVFDASTTSARVLERFDQLCQVAWLNISVSPRSAYVTVDDAVVDEANRVRWRVRPGPHRIVATVDTRSDAADVQVGRGGVQNVRLDVPGGPAPLWRRGFISFNHGYHMLSQSFSNGFNFVAFTEAGDGQTSYSVPDGFRHNEFGGAVRVVGALALGVTYSRLDTPMSGFLSARIPHPTLRNRHRPLSADVIGLQRDERAYHVEIRATGGNDRVEGTAFAGPSFFTVRQSFVSGVTWVESLGVPVFTRATTVEREEKSKIGFHLGADLGIYVIKYFGFGFFGRYSRATMEPPTGGVDVEAIAGGLQFGGGLRARF
jgi:hypothetical protein